jgi:hypothetical protein
VALAGWLGPCVSEAFGLQWQDLDTASRVVWFRRGFVQGRITPLKTEASRSELSLPDDLVDLLEQWRSITPYNQPHDWVHSTSLGLRFDIQALGQPQVVNGLVSADLVSTRICGTQPGQPTWCVEPSFTDSPIMREFYRRKRSGTLDEFTLKDGIELARTLIQATLKTAQPSWGVGGPIDILTVTKTGTHRVAQKHEQTVPPPFHESMRFNTFANSVEPVDLDGLQCLLCTFRNVNLFYNGTGRVELVRPRFEGSCELTLGGEAREQRPQDVEYLEHLVSGHCQIK